MSWRSSSQGVARLVCVVFAMAGSLKAQEQELIPAADLESGVESLIGGLLGGGAKLEGRIKGAVLIEEHPDRVRVRVRYQGLEGATLAGKILDADHNRLDLVVSTPVTLGSGQTSAELEFHLVGPVATGTLASSYLRLEVKPPERSLVAMIRNFALRKQWRSGGAAGGTGSGSGWGVDNSVPAPEMESKVVALNPQPVGETPVKDSTTPPAGGGTARRPSRATSTVKTPTTTVMLALLPKVDLYKLASSARWSNRSATLPFNGPSNDRRGFVHAFDKKRLADGKDYASVLQTHPEWKSKGRIEGVFNITIPQNAKTLDVGLGYLPGAGGDGVSMSVLCDVEGKRTTLLKSYHLRPGSVVQKSIKLPANIKGKRCRLTLSTYAGNSSAQDWAVWIYPRIN